MAGVATGNGAVLNDTGSEETVLYVWVTVRGGVTASGMDDTANAPVVLLAVAVHVKPFESVTDTTAPGYPVPVNVYGPKPEAASPVTGSNLPSCTM